MSCVEYLDHEDHETPLIKNEIIMSNLNLYGNEYLSLKEEEKNDEKSLSEESNFENFIKREFTKEMTSKNNISDEEDDDFDDTRRYEIENYRHIKTTNNINYNNNNSNNNHTSSNIFCCNNNNINSFSNLSNEKPMNNMQKKIFNIVKIPKNKNIFQCLQRKREIGEKSKKFLLDWDNIKVPKEKHFHFDRKKHRIVFQRRHLKVIYSIVDLTYPFNFNKCFDMIKKHIGDKTIQNYGKGKSFHIIKINNEEKIVTLKDKKILLREDKIKKKNALYYTNHTNHMSNKEYHNNNHKTLLFKEVYKK